MSPRKKADNLSKQQKSNVNRMVAGGGREIRRKCMSKGMSRFPHGINPSRFTRLIWKRLLLVIQTL